ncbi:MAG: peptidoglycan DL-endopeptidase CwlO [Frankiaceae bacterium]|nr:peptidoglycan DL-endopeptidase CwlO [Frankiaceae bacterium]
MPAGLLRLRVIRAAIVTFLAAAIVVPSMGATAEAATTSVRTTASVAQKVLTLAAKEHGKPYSYGGSGPSSFDCSGFTSFVFRQVGVSLPHSAAAQYAVVHHITKASKRPGDLIFMYGSGGIYHVAIYAGNNEMWAATHTGDVVRKERIYSSSYKVGRA